MNIIISSKIKKNQSERNTKLALRYMTTLTAVAREPFLILNSDLRVLSANTIFYQNFQVTPRQTENKILYNLGNGQWNIPKLKKLIKEILPKKKIVNNYEVKHIFEKIGAKTILLNARQIDSEQLIIIAMEDITTRKILEEKLTKHSKDLEFEVAKRTKELAARIKELEILNKSMVGRELKMVELKKEIENIKKRLKNGNNNNNHHYYNNHNHGQKI